MIAVTLAILIGLLALAVPVAAALGVLGLALSEIYSRLPLSLAMGEMAWATSNNFLLVAVPFFAKVGRARASLLASSAAIAALWGIVGQGLIPNIVPALGAPERSLTIMHASASPTVLTSLLVVLLLVLTLVAGYSAFVFLRFRRAAT